MAKRNRPDPSPTPIELFQANQRLVYFLWSRNSSRFPLLEPEDAQALGMIGLWKAAKTYQPDLGNAFSTYASVCIQNEWKLETRKESRRMGLGRGIKQISLSRESTDLPSPGPTLEDSLEDPRPSPEDEAIGRAEVERLFSQLSRDEKRVLILKALGNGRVRISRTLGTTPGWTAKQLRKVVRLVEKLRDPRDPRNPRNPNSGPPVSI